MKRKQPLKLCWHAFEIAVLTCVMLVPVSLLWAQSAPTSADTLSRVRQTSALRLGYYTDARPLSYQDEAGKPAGYAIDLCQGIAKDLKTDLGLSSINIEFIPVASSDRYEALKQGRIDLLCGPSAETLTRRKEVDFSIPIFPGGVGALIRADAPATLRDALAGHEPPFRPQWRATAALNLQTRSFSAVKSTTTLDWLKVKRAEFKINPRITPVDNHEAGVQLVLERKTDVLFGERSILIDAVKRSASRNDLLVFDRLFTYEPLAMALPRGDEDFRAFVDRSLSRLYRSGAVQAIYQSSLETVGENTLTFFRLSAIPE